MQLGVIGEGGGGGGYSTSPSRDSLSPTTLLFNFDE